MSVTHKFPPKSSGILEFPQGNIDETEFGYLDNLTSAIQTQLNSKASSSAVATAQADATQALLDVAAAQADATQALLDAAAAQADATQALSDAAAASQPGHTHAGGDIASGQVAPARGGTGSDLSAANRGSIPYVGASGSGVQAMLAPGTAGQALFSGGAGADPYFGDVGGGVSTGTILAYGASSPPTGYLACDGSAVSRTTYATLFGVLGTTWGAGNGSTTFNVPDLRGRAPIGSGTGSGLTARTLATQYGSENTTLTAAQSGLPSHTHSITVFGETANATGGANYAGSPSAGSTGAAGGTSASSSHSNMQPSVAVAYIIKT